MTCCDVLQGSACPIHMVRDGPGGNLLVCDEVNRKGLPRCKQVQTEVHRNLCGALYLKLCRIGDL